MFDIINNVTFAIVDGTISTVYYLFNKPLGNDMYARSELMFDPVDRRIEHDFHGFGKSGEEVVIVSDPSIVIQYLTKIPREYWSGDVRI